MAGTVTTTEQIWGSVQKVIFTWTSDASGDADGATDSPVSGKLLAVTTIPDGADAPTDQYDVTLTDGGGHDVALGALANRATATTEHVKQADLGAMANGPLTINVSNAGNAKKGVLVVWLR